MTDETLLTRTRSPADATDIITDKTLDFIRKRDPSRPFFAMCHHKAPHRSWECDPKHRHLYKDPVKLPETFTDDYKNRARAAAIAKMRVESDMSYGDLGLSQPEGGSEVGDLELPGYWFMSSRKVPMPDDVTTMRPLVDRETGEQFTFKTREELSQFKYQRYMQRYLRCIQSIDDNMGRTLDFLEAEGLAENTIVIYTCAYHSASSLLLRLALTRQLLLRLQRTRASSSANTAGSTSASSTRSRSRCPSSSAGRRRSRPGPFAATSCPTSTLRRRGSRPPACGSRPTCRATRSSRRSRAFRALRTTRRSPTTGASRSLPPLARLTEPS